jgi:hypothetical protein
MYSLLIHYPESPMHLRAIVKRQSATDSDSTRSNRSSALSAGARGAALMILLALCSVGFLPGAARAQLFTFGAGAGAGAGTRGTGTFTHAAGFLQIKPPVLPGIRGELIALEGAGDHGPLAITVDAVLSPSIPVVSPYLIGGWGQYGVGKSSGQSGWNVGAGVRLALGIGVFAEYRRHQRIARDLFTIGVTF